MFKVAKARITGMSYTDWSWAGLLADLDNDDWKDVFVTNGTRRDINNKYKDYNSFADATLEDVYTAQETPRNDASYGQ